ncbi:MAG: response regulator transcription factor [Pseudomonadota bacterium]
MTPPRLLIVDDDPRLREMLGYSLRREGFTVLEAGDGAAALALLAREAVDLVVLDVLMPELDGLEVCRRLRRTSSVPMIFLSSRGEELDRVLGLELGGDDYIAKPFSPRELVSRVRAVLRRSRPEEPAAQAEDPEEILACGPLRLDVSRHRCCVGARELDLTLTEFRMLQALLGASGRVLTRQELIDQAYDGRHFVSDRTVDSHLRRVRQKLREEGLDPIETVHGLGFRLRDP